MTADLTLICGTCGFPIAEDTGCLRVTMAEVRDHLRQYAEWRQAHPEGSAIDLAELLLAPDEIHWGAYHYACDPARGEDQYQIDAGRIATWRAVCHWTAHLMEKNWFAATDWDDLLRELAGDSPASTFRILERSA